MPTLMTQPTFDMLAVCLRQLSDKSVAEGIGPSHIFVPWAGEQLIAKGRGIYYVGIALNAEGRAEQKKGFQECLQGTENFCRRDLTSRRGTPFWRFVDRLSLEILGETYSLTQEKWGWSNLLKVAGSAGSPARWPDALIDGQRTACIAALREEIARLRDSLIVVTSANEYGILFKAVAEENLWDKQPRQSNIWWLRDPVSGNTYVRCYHPNNMQQRNFFEAAVNDVVRLARETLPPF